MLTASAVLQRLLADQTEVCELVSGRLSHCQSAVVILMAVCTILSKYLARQLVGQQEVADVVHAI